MNTPEQQALQLAAQAWCAPATSGLEMDVNLATAVAEKFAPIIAENAALKAELAAIKGAGEPVAWANSSTLESAKLGRERYGNQGATELHTWSEGGPSDCYDTPLYTRPATPLTNEQIWSLAMPHITHYQFGEATHRDINCLGFARAIEAAHNIKGAKP